MNLEKERLIMKKLFKIFIVLSIAIGLSTGIALADENILPDSVSALGEITLTDTGWSGMSQTSDCVEGWGNDWWSLTLTEDRDVTVEVIDCCCPGDLYEVVVDDCVIGQTPKPDPYKWGCDQTGPLSEGSFTVSLKAGTYLIKVRDFAFDDHQGDMGSMCPAGYTVIISLGDYTGIPWPCGGFPGEAELEAIEAKLDALSSDLPIQLGEITRLINILVPAVEALEAKSDALEAKLDAVEAKLDEGEVVTQSDLADGLGGVYFMGAKKQRPGPPTP
jgi:hypothetical protein